MKRLIALIALSLSFSVLAQEQVLLNAEEVTVNGTEAILHRTRNTPKNVKVTFKVPMSSTVCERYETRYHPVRVMVHCGTDYRIQRFNDRVCTRRNPYNKECLNWEIVPRVERIPVRRMCPEIRQVPDTYCADYGTAVRYKYDHMKLTFKKLPALADNETDSFRARARQDGHGSSDVEFELTSDRTVTDYKIKRKKILGIFKRDGFNISVK